MCRTSDLFFVEHDVNFVAEAARFRSEVDPEATAPIQSVQEVRDPRSIFCGTNDHLEVSGSGVGRVNCNRKTRNVSNVGVRDYTL